MNSQITKKILKYYRTVLNFVVIVVTEVKQFLILSRGIDLNRVDACNV